jgi:hypothetical protein
MGERVSAKKFPALQKKGRSAGQQVCAFTLKIAGDIQADPRLFFFNIPK